MGLYPHDTFRIRPEFLGFPQPGQIGDTISAVTAQESVKASGGAFVDRGKKKQTAGDHQKKTTDDSVKCTKPTTLQKVDYLDHIEKTGLDVIDLMMRHNTKVNVLTSKLRERLSEKIENFSQLDNDSWRIVNYLNPHQEQIRTLLEH